MALSLFLCYYSALDWKSVIINIDSSLSAIDLKPLSVQAIFPENSPLLGLENANSEEIQQITSLITNYRLRYQSTIWASSRAKDDDNLEPGVETLRDSSTERESEDRLSASHLDPNSFRLPKGAPAWGLASVCPSLTNEFQSPPGLSAESEVWETQIRKKSSNSDGPHQFNVSPMNVSDSIRPYINLTSSISSADVVHITSILSSGYTRFATVLRKCREVALQGDFLDVGLGSKMELSNYFISEAMGMSRDIANAQKLSSFSPDDATNIDELKSSKYFCESEGPESVMRHAELIMGSKITADAVAHLIAHIVEQAGPHPIGEIGKLLQEATGNPNLSRVLKSQFRGLKKLIEGYPHMLRLGGDHSFNPHVYLSEKQCCNSVSDASVDVLLDSMTDRESDDPPVSPPGSFSLQTIKKQPSASPSNCQINVQSINPSDGYQYSSNGPIKNQQNVTHQYQMPYRSEIIAPKTRGTGNTPPWQLQENNGKLFAPSPPGFSNQSRNSIGSIRLHADAGEFEPSRSVDYYNGIRQRSDHYGMEINGSNRSGNQQISGNSISQSYTPYRLQSFDQSQYLYSGGPSRSAASLPRQNTAYQANNRGNQPSVRSSGNPLNSRFDNSSDSLSYNDIPGRNSISGANRISYSNSTNSGYPPAVQSWERNGANQYDSEGSFSSTQIATNQTNRTSHGSIGDTRASYGIGYDLEFSRPTLSSFGHGRLQSAENVDIGLEFESDRQSFLLPSDYDLVSQPYSISDYDILKDAAFANTIDSFGQEHEDNGTTLGNRQYLDRDILSSATGNRLDVREPSLNGDSKMLAYFLRDS